MPVSKQREDDLNARPQWSSAWVFVLIVSGAVVGLSNISLFPSVMAKNGGAAFLVLYVLSLLLIGFPIIILEMLFGRMMKSNAVDAIKGIAKQNQLSKHWSLVGVVAILAGLFILSFFSVVAGWSMAYMFRMLGDTFVAVDLTQTNEIFNSIIGDAERLMAWHTLFLLVTAFIVGRGVKQGIERWVKVLMPVFFLLLISIVMIAALTNGFAEGLSYLLLTDFDRLLDGKAILAAMSTAFISLSLGRAAILTFSSYLPSNVSIVKTAGSVVLLDILVVVLAGMAVFPIIFSADIDIAAIGDANLIFQVLPLAFANMPFGHLLGFLFFAMMLIAALTSAIALLEPIVCWMIENKPITRYNAIGKCTLIVWFLGIGTIFSFNIWSGYTWTFEMDLNKVQLLLFKDKSFFDIIEYISSKVMVPISAFMMVILAGHFMLKSSLQDELGENKKVFEVWYFVIQNITPLLLFIVLLHAVGFLS